MPKLRPLMLIPPLVFIGFVALAAVGMFRDDPEGLPSARVGQSAPPMVLTALEGKATFDDATLRDGKVKLVNFWASWCAPCRVEHPQLTKLAQQGIPIYGINYKDDPEKGLGFLNELGDPFIALMADPSGRTAIDWGLYGVPETYIVDGKGEILFRFAGPMVGSDFEQRFMPALREAMGQ